MKNISFLLLFTPYISLYKENKMIVADRKPFDEIMTMIAPYERILLLGCNECVTVCAVGGTRETALLASQIRIKRQMEGRTARYRGENARTAVRP